MIYNPDYFNLIYIGYYNRSNSDNILLCVSSDINKVKYYIKEIRKIPKKLYSIREVALDRGTIESLYYNHMLENYIEPYYYLTRADIQALSDEIECYMDRWTDLFMELQDYREYIEDIPRLRETSPSIVLAEKELENHLTRNKNLKKLFSKVIEKSPITSSNIEEYLRSVRVTKESRELTEMFYRKIQEDK